MMVYDIVFYLTLFKVLINMHEYWDELTCIINNVIKRQFLSFNLVPSLVVLLKKQLRYDWFCRVHPDSLDSHYS